MDRVPEELQMEICDIVQEAVIKIILKKKKFKMKMVVWEGLTNSWEGKKLKIKDKRKDIPIWMQNSKE